MAHDKNRPKDRKRMFKGNLSSNQSDLPKQRRLLLHIGHHKTGSTTIQDALATGRVSVEGVKILYPSLMAHNYLRKQIDDYLASVKLPKGEIGFPNLEEISHQLRDELYDVAILSAEEFEGAKPADVQKVLAKLMLPHVNDYKVVCYVRPHAGRIMSSYAEQLKLGLDVGTPDEFFEKTLANGRFQYHPKLSSWASTFGENFVLRPMIRSELAGSSVLVDFLKTGLGADCDITLTQESSSNEALSLEDLMVLKLVHRQLVNRGRNMHHRLGWNLSILLAGLTKQNGRGTKLVMHKELAEKVRAAYLRDAANLDAVFFYDKHLMRDDLDRAVDAAQLHPQSVEPEDHLSQDTMRAVAVLTHQINLMLDHSDGPWQKFFFNQRVEHLHGSQALKVRSQTNTKLKSSLLLKAPSTLKQAAQDTQFKDFVDGVLQGTDTAGKDIPKIIWLFWHSGFETAPDVVRKSLKTWQHFNPDYEVRDMDSTIASRWLGLDLEKLFDSLTVEMGWAVKADIIRMMLLAKFGGVWADATTFCLKPLSDWLPNEAEDIGFFAFRNVTKDRDKDLRIWFLAATASNQIILNTLRDMISLFCKKRNKKVEITEFRGYKERYNIKIGDFPDLSFLENAEKKYGSLPYFCVPYLFQYAIKEVPGAFAVWVKQSNRYSMDKSTMMVFARAYVAKHTHRGAYQGSQFFKDRVTALFDGENVRSNYRPSEFTGKLVPYAWHQVSRSLQISEARKVIFVNIPKSGGHLIDSSNLFEDGVLRHGHTKFMRYAEILGQRILDFRVLTIIRNPWDRLASAFFSVSLAATEFRDFDAKLAESINTEFGADFAKFLDAFVENPDIFMSSLWFQKSINFFDPRTCEIPCFVQKIEKIDDISELKGFLSFPGLEMPLLVNGLKCRKFGRFYTPETFEKVKQIYYDDVEAFGYQSFTLSDLRY